MATLSEPDRLSDDESADLFNRVERFRAAWKADGSGGMARFLPPHGARHRPAVLVQVAVADMERRAAAGLPFRVDTYTTRFPKDFIREAPPVALLIAEYRLRHQHADKPDLSEYRDRFPARYDELTRGLQAQHGLSRAVSQADVPPADAPPPEHSGATQVSSRKLPDTAGPRKSTLHDSRPPVTKSRGSKVGDLVVTHGGDLDATPVRGSVSGKSTILPNDAPYELLRKLGEGAFGEVFEALAPGGIRVAVKRISRNVDHPASLAEREALEVVKNLAHPFLLKTQAYWVFDDRLVIVMELADGSLADKVSQHQAKGRMGVPPEELIPLFEQSAKALDYLHSQNVSHRDIKPENILILKEHAKVGDFGLARTQEHTMTMVGQTVGTPAYMAPEMWQQKVSIHSDQYSLAATYVRCRLGRNLFETTVLIEMASFHIHETPNLGNLSQAEQAVLLKALAKNPDDRFPSCEEFARALRAAVLSPAMGTGGSNFGLQGGTAIRNALQVDAPARPGPLRAMLPVIAVALTCVVTMVIALIVLIPKLIPPPPGPPTAPNADATKGGGGAAVPPVPDKKYARVPGWEPAGLADALLIRDKLYPRKLTRQVGGEALEAILVFRGSESEPDDPFYVLKNKVTNRVFAATWDAVVRNQKTELDLLRTKIKPFPAGWWRQGFKAEGEGLGIGGEQSGVPVVAVTLPEAIFAARELGGQLPTFVEWRLAAGSGDVRTGPAGSPLVVPAPELDVNNQDLTPEQKVEAVKFTRAALAKRNLALGLTRGPWPVDRETADLSKPWGVHQLVTNGSEWLGNIPNTNQLIDLNGVIPAGLKRASVIGHDSNEFEIATFDRLEPGVQEWLEPDKSTGFRVVLLAR